MKKPSINGKPPFVLGPGCLPASGARPAGGPRPRGPLGLSQRGPDPHGPPTLEEPTRSSSRSCLDAAELGGSTQGAHVAASATPAATQCLRVSARGKEAGLPASFTDARRHTRGVRYRLTRFSRSTSRNLFDASATHGFRDVVFPSFGSRIRGPPHGGPIGVPADGRSGNLVTRVESALGPPVSGQSSPNDFVVHGVGGAYEAYVPVMKTLLYSRDFGALGISSSGRCLFVAGVAEGSYR